MLVKIETDEGIYGWGESGLSSREMGVKGIIEHYREFLVGRDPMQRGALWQEMYRSQYFEGGRTMTAAMSAMSLSNAARKKDWPSRSSLADSTASACIINTRAKAKTSTNHVKRSLFQLKA